MSQAPGFLAFLDRAQGGHGGHGPDPLRVRPRPHDRQPAGLSRARGAQPLRRPAAVSCSTAPGSGSSAPSCSTAVSLHIWSATSLTLESRRARPEGYREQKWKESTYASRTMRWGGVIILLFVIYHLLHFTTGTVHPSFIEGDIYHNFVAGFQSVPVSLFYIVAMLALGLHLRHGVWSMFQTLGVSHPRYMRIGARRGLDLRGPRRRRQHLLPDRGARRDRQVVRGGRMELRANIPSGPLEKKWDKHRFEMKLVNPANKRKYTRDHGGLGPGRSRRRRLDGRARLQGEVLLLPGLAPPRALDRGAGRHQRVQELPQRRRQRLSPLLRHGQGRRLPRPRGQRLPAGGGLGQHHRPVRGAGRALRARVRRPARQPLLRRRAGLAHLLRARADGPAAPARRLPGARAPDRPGQGRDVPAPRDAGAHRRRRPRPRHRRARHGHGRGRDAPRGRRVPGDRRLRQRLLPGDVRQGLQRARRSGAPTRRARRSRTRASPRSTRRASR